MRLGWLALAIGVSGCVTVPALQETLRQSEAELGRASTMYARVCAPAEVADAESAQAFAQLEMQQGDLRRAQDHADFALKRAKDAVTAATPCGSADRDVDTIIDLLDGCPDEPEDFDGVDDDDGCRDIDPVGDEDGDGLRNIDDACVYEPEDFDGHDDDDGCPETSNDSDGDGIVDAADHCPVQAEDVDRFEDADGCPEPDNDKDTVTDLVDDCPLIAEDLDGWDDDDGCPDPDNDVDGIADVDDACPNQAGPRAKGGCPENDRDSDGIGDEVDRCPDVPETKNDYLDDDGCPDKPPTKIRVTRKTIEISDTIQFETGKATLLPASTPLLDEVVGVLTDVPTMTLRIEGHTDSDGSEEANLRLSRERAESVKAYLESRGIKPDRLEARGFGETVPIDTNRTPAGKARNRRVEFHITGQ